MSPVKGHCVSSVNLTLYLLFHRTLAAVKPNVFAIEDQLKPFPCEAFRDTLTASQYDLCRQDNYLMSAVVSGTHKALYTCQRLFEGCIWNCSVNEKDHLLGSAIEATGKWLPACSYVLCSYLDWLSPLVHS